GIIAEVCTLLATLNVNINDINQTVMQNDFFTMVMLADVSKSNVSFGEISESLNKKGEEMGLSIKIQLEDIFNAMHKI
ncbi:MAG: ACT domain-containing protein, partial [Clostridia bacterium]|nr:ACT domain-containing protein [Clostridia bacterium]